MASSRTGGRCNCALRLRFHIIVGCHDGRVEIASSSIPCRNSSCDSSKGGISSKMIRPPNKD